MGLSFSSSPPKSIGKPSTLLPLVGNGMYEVGCVDVMLKDENGDESGFFARIFYPSTLKKEHIEYPIWRPRNEYIVGLAEYRQVSPMKINFFLDWIIGERRVPAVWHAPLFHRQTSHRKFDSDLHEVDASEDPDDKGLTADATNPIFPVVVFSHGISGNRLCYSTLCASLASHGFVVAALEHRDRSSSWTYYLERNETGELSEKPVRMTTFPDGEEEFKERNGQVYHRVTECLRCLKFFDEINSGQHTNAEANAESLIVYGHEFNWTQFKNRLDLSKAVIVGHSFGGATAIAAVADPTSGFHASVVLDGWLYPLEDAIYERVARPILFLNASRWQWHENVRRMMRLCAQCTDRVILTLKDIVHQSFSDFGFLTPGYFGRYFSLQGDLEPAFTGKAIQELIVTFLNHHFSDVLGKDVSLTETLQSVIKPYEQFILVGTDLDLSHKPGVNEKEVDGHGTPAIIDGGGNLGENLPVGEVSDEGKMSI